MAERVTKGIIVKASVEDAYALWENFENFPHFMKNIRSVTRPGPKSSHWVMSGPLGRDVEWDAETTRLASLVEPAPVRRTVRAYYAGRQELAGPVWNLLSLRLWLDGVASSAAAKAA